MREKLWQERWENSLFMNRSCCCLETGLKLVLLENSFESNFNFLHEDKRPWMSWKPEVERSPNFWALVRISSQGRKEPPKETEETSWKYSKLKRPVKEQFLMLKTCVTYKWTFCYVSNKFQCRISVIFSCCKHVLRRNKLTSCCFNEVQRYFSYYNHVCGLFMLQTFLKFGIVNFLCWKHDLMGYNGFFMLKSCFDVEKVDFSCCKHVLMWNFSWFNLPIVFESRWFVRVEDLKESLNFAFFGNWN